MTATEPMIAYSDHIEQGEKPRNGDVNGGKNKGIRWYLPITNGIKGVD